MNPETPRSRQGRTSRPSRRRAAADRSARTTGPQPSPAGRQAPHPRRRENDIVIYAVVAVVALTVIVLGAGLYLQYFRRPALPVAVVNGHAISNRDYQVQGRIRSYDVQTQIQDVQQRLSTSPDDPELLAQFQLLQSQIGGSSDQPTTDLVDDYLLNQAVPSLVQQGAPSLTVSTADVETRLAQWKQAGNVATAADYQQLLSRLKVDDQQIHDYLRATILQERVQAFIAKDVATAQPQVKAKQVVIQDKAKADEALAKLKANGDFATLVDQYAADASAKADGGEVGWEPKGVQSAAFDSFAFASTPPAPLSFSDVLQASNGYLIIGVQDRAALRPLDSVQLQKLKDKQFKNWLLTREHSASILRYPENQTTA